MSLQLQWRWGIHSVWRVMTGFRRPSALGAGRVRDALPMGEIKNRSGVLIFDVFHVWKSKLPANPRFLPRVIAEIKNRGPVLNFDLFRLWKSGTAKAALNNNQIFLFKRPLNPLGFSQQKSKQSKQIKARVRMKGLENRTNELLSLVDEDASDGL